jgi:hypothetical protein
MRVALVTFGGLPLLAYVLVSIACTLSNPIAVARVAFIYMAVLLSASLFFPLDDWRRRTAKLIADGKGDVPLVHLRWRVPDAPRYAMPLLCSQSSGVWD